MSVAIILSEKPAVVLADPVYISHRIDPNPFKPEYIHSDLKLDNYASLGGEVSPFQCVLKNGKEGLSGGATPLGANYQSSGVRFVRTGEVNDCWIDGDSCVFISSEDDQSIKRSKLKDRDILLTITGACFGKAAEVTAKLLPANISQHSVRLRFKESLFTSFIVAYLNSKTGQLQILKQTVGSTRQAIDYIGINKIRIPIPDMLLQKYIGEKLLLAERCREEALNCTYQSNSIFEQHWQPTNVALTGSFAANTEIDVLNNDRLDPEFYRSDLLAMREKVQRSKSGHIRIGKFGESFSGKTPSDKGNNDSLCEIVRVANLTGRGLDWSNRLFGTIGKSEKGLLKDGDIIVCKDAHQKYYIGQQVDIYCRSNHHAVASSETLVIRFQREHINPFAALIYLRSKEGYAAFQQQIRGTSAHLYPTDVENIVVPKIPEDAEKQIEQLIRRAEHCRIRAYALTDEAKSDVEALIEGKLDTDAILSGKLKAPTWEDIEKELEGI